MIARLIPWIFVALFIIIIAQHLSSLTDPVFVQEKCHGFLWYDDTTNMNHIITCGRGQ